MPNSLLFALRQLKTIPQKMPTAYRLLLTAYCVLFTASALFAQDTLRVSLGDVDSLFLKNNFALIANKYQIGIAQAQATQLKLWDNPTLSTEWNLYNPTRGKVLDIGYGGEKILTLTQLIRLAHKREKGYDLGMAQAQTATYQFEDLLRNLRFALRNEYYSIYFKQLTVSKYDKQIALLQTIIDAYEVQVAKGNIALKDVVRLKAAAFALNNDRTELLDQLLDHQNNLRVLTGSTAFLLPKLNEQALLSRQANTDLVTLQGIALKNRPDALIAQSITKQADLNLKLQESLAVPDLHVGITYDQNGSYVANYTAVQVGIDLPVLNKNQYNIAAAALQIDQSKAAANEVERHIANDVLNAYAKLLLADREYLKIDKKMAQEFDDLNKGMTENFQKRNLSLVEFIDLFEAYNEQVTQINRIKANRITALEGLNFAVGKAVF
jgi:outer membrane protein, heavy metal efflux system